MKVLKEVITTYIEEDGKIKITEKPLVRCGECKWWNEETHGCNRNPSVNAWWETDFCSYGERRAE